MACGYQRWGPQDCGLALTGHPLWPGDPLAPPMGPSLPSFSCLLLDPRSQEGTPLLHAQAVAGFGVPDPCHGLS